MKVGVGLTRKRPKTLSLGRTDSMPASHREAVYAHDITLFLIIAHPSVSGARIGFKHHIIFAVTRSHLILKNLLF